MMIWIAVSKEKYDISHCNHKQINIESAIEVCATSIPKSWETKEGQTKRIAWWDQGKRLYNWNQVSFQYLNSINNIDSIFVRCHKDTTTKDNNASCWAKVLYNEEERVSAVNEDVLSSWIYQHT